METWAWQEGSCQEFRLMVGICSPGGKVMLLHWVNAVVLGFLNSVHDLKPRDIL